MFFDIPNKDGLWVYQSPMTTNNQSWQTWVKPTQYNNFIFYVCGGGGGGAGGQTNSAGLVRRGGGGGAGGALNILNTPSYLLPETLYINIGRGGPIANAGINGNAGAATYLNYFPNTNTANTLIVSNGGSGGLGSASAGAGGAAVAPYTNQSIFSIGGTFSTAGTQGGLNAGTDLSITTSCIYGGTGGGGADASNVGYSGGNILASNIHPQLDGGNASVGQSGYLIKKPFTALGGTGGGGVGTAAAFAGGNGCWGSGGGGGGAGVGAGRGGAGGDGFIIIIGY